MFPKRLGSHAPTAQPRRSRALYLGVPAFLVACWLLFWLRPPHGSGDGTEGTLLQLRGASLASSGDAGRLQRLEEGVDGLRAQLGRLAGALEAREEARGAAAAAAPPPPAAAPPPPPPPPPPPSPPPPARRPAVLGMAKGIDAVGAYRFVRSLRAHMPGAEAVIFTDAESLAKDPLLPWLYEAFGVTLEVFSVESLPAAQRGYHPSSYRWILMRDYLRRRAAAGGGAPPFSGVFFSDVRDTVFQGDLFEALRGGPGGGAGFYAFQEQRPGTIAQCGWNSGWVKDCFGEEGLARVGGNVVSCSGTSAASWADAMAYVELMGAQKRGGAARGALFSPSALAEAPSYRAPLLPFPPSLPPPLQRKRSKTSRTASGTASTRASTTTLCTLGSWPRASPRCTCSATRRALSPPCSRCPWCTATPRGGW
jgi:hypothetical protein